MKVFLEITPWCAKFITPANENMTCRTMSQDQINSILARLDKTNETLGKIIAIIGQHHKDLQELKRQVKVMDTRIAVVFETLPVDDPFDEIPS